MKTDVILGNRCRLTVFRDDETSEGPCFICVEGAFSDESGRRLYDRLRKHHGRHFVFCELFVEDWDEMLTPWASDDAERRFTGRGPQLLAELENRIVPELSGLLIRQKDGSGQEQGAGQEQGQAKGQGHTKESGRDKGQGVYLVGYSLAGLFSLWSVYESDLFQGCASCSGSLWYPGWTEYAKEHCVGPDKRIYLSLGKKEEQAGSPVMRTVGEATRMQERCLSEQLTSDIGGKVILEWNDGGHFSDPETRLYKGIQWLLKAVKMNQEN